ncbi:hypothetical protein KM043_010066 [Ampulex compressa]|nr:hypothetical protein KM043_010066 [Ampulex compressa]
MIDSGRAQSARKTRSRQCDVPSSFLRRISPLDCLRRSLISPEIPRVSSSSQRGGIRAAGQNEHAAFSSSPQGDELKRKLKNRCSRYAGHCVFEGLPSDYAISAWILPPSFRRDRPFLRAGYDKRNR